jgi:hypothetical protein
MDVGKEIVVVIHPGAWNPAKVTGRQPLTNIAVDSRKEGGEQFAQLRMQKHKRLAPVKSRSSNE